MRPGWRYTGTIYVSTLYLPQSGPEEFWSKNNLLREAERREVPACDRQVM